MTWWLLVGVQEGLPVQKKVRIFEVRVILFFALWFLFNKTLKIHFLQRHSWGRRLPF